jgi:transmembrane sensor
MNKERLQELAKKYLDGTATEAERQALHTWYDTADDDEIEMVFINRNETADNIQNNIFAGIRQKIVREPGEYDQPVEKNSIPMIKRKRPAVWLAAASIIGILALGAWFFISRYNSNPQLANKEKNAPAHQQPDVQPGSDKARLQLADGRVMILEDVKDGAIQTDNGITIKKQNGQLLYDASVAQQHAEASYNVISTPRGGQYQVVLPDGSKVWLNASSSLRFPTVFTSKERRVQLTGEAYFEVAHNAQKPFIVNVKDKEEVTVLGTHFNINAYEDENAIHTTLLQGSVKVATGNRPSYARPLEGAAEGRKQSAILKPGEQVSLSESYELSKPIPVQTEEVMAWKNGMFQFNETDIPSIMRQISRWYNVEVDYSKNIPVRYFSGEIPRDVPLSKMLQLLELGGLHFKMEGNKIIVSH